MYGPTAHASSLFVIQSHCMPLEMSLLLDILAVLFFWSPFSVEGITMRWDLFSISDRSIDPLLQSGLVGCGSRIAHGLAQYGLGDDLLTAVDIFGDDRDGLSEFLSHWRDSLRHHLQTDPLGYIGHRNMALAASLPDTFPNFEALHCYAHPITSPQNILSRLSLSFIRHPPQFNLSQLVSLCELWFSWHTSYVILHKFSRYVWPGIVLRAVVNKWQKSTQSPIVSIYC